MQVQAEIANCEFCRRSLYSLYWTCHVCGESYCYPHADRHPPEHRCRGCDVVLSKEDYRTHTESLRRFGICP